MSYKKISGFSLLEMSIVLLVIAVALGSGLMITNKYSNQSDREKTEEKIQYVLNVIKQYAQKYNKLPCPADPTLPFTDANYGVALFDSGAGECDLTVYNDTSRGMIPFVALGLHPNYTVDAWGNRLHYIVKTTTAVDDGLSTHPSLSANPGELKLLNYGGTQYSNIVVIVLSTGENAYGAYSGRGGAQKSYVAANSKEALACSAEYMYTSPPTENFDDIVNFWTYEQIKSSLMK